MRWRRVFFGRCRRRRRSSSEGGGFLVLAVLAFGLLWGPLFRAKPNPRALIGPLIFARKGVSGAYADLWYLGKLRRLVSEEG